MKVTVGVRCALVGVFAVCASVPVDASEQVLQAEVRWEGVVTGGLEPAGTSFEGVFSLVTFGEDLYASTLHFGSGNAGIWRTADGREWQRVDGGRFEGSFLVGPMVVFEDHLFVASRGIGLFRSADGTTYELAGNQIFGLGRVPTSFAVFQDALYVGTDGNDRDGGARGQVWRSRDGLSWEPVETSGFGDAGNTAVTALLAADGAIYAGTHNSATGGEVWRSFDGSTWTQVSVDGFGDPLNDTVADLHLGRDGVIFASTSNDVSPGLWRMVSAFGWSEVDDAQLAAGGGSIWALTDFNGQLWAAVSREMPTGAEMWRSDDGVSWRPQVLALGGAHNEAIFATAVFKGSLYVGTTGNRGAELWRATPLLAVE